MAKLKRKLRFAEKNYMPNDIKTACSTSKSTLNVNPAWNYTVAGILSVLIPFLNLSWSYTIVNHTKIQGTVLSE